ncbi:MULTISPECIES: nicotinate (nicotinamide) nucleotide adenylyltransferase [unclassified Pusillimonas]|uniref:nicotinate (nicotinamide) nucleotide adenylyltransferase n=1 Tax=unclassified Pusillimonas TaxID=2640016 RepID=UPI000B9D2509|nr:MULTISPECIES: nicotinate (nicotinamide) nucleotide adenylyltransferase [unclassified Pusillimonas]OXR48537.1 nicotinate (nicotinamide) nucleotide adenylyltransferase [Pusillimonas sp. T2]ROT46203.1 nicotinate (nicotinamide) nucleotide adenylyltransferase [Pusillimonas sp. NJUB218]
MALKKIGLLGGSFDPVHRAHIALAATARDSLLLDEVQLIPAADPWQRAPLKATARQRCDMLELAIRAQPKLVVNPIEIERGGKTYTIDTLESLPRDAQYFWVLGTDQLANFCSWHRWEDILIYVHLVVANRPGTALEAPAPLQYLLDALKKPIIELTFEPMSVSATAIRNAIVSETAIDAFVDPAVEQYIKQHRLYQS